MKTKFNLYSLFREIGLPPIFDTVVNKVNFLVSTRGWVGTLPILKEAKLAVMRHAAGHPISHLEVKSISLDKDGLPRLLPKEIRDKLQMRD